MVEPDMHAAQRPQLAQPRDLFSLREIGEEEIEAHRPTVSRYGAFPLRRARLAQLRTQERTQSRIVAGCPF